MPQSDAFEIGGEIAYLVSHTSIGYFEAMQMPYCIMFAMIKHLRIEELCQNEEWRKAYAQYLISEGHKNGTLHEQKEMDMQGLQAFTNSL
ncbi:hypothetical protein [Enterococcus sp.]|uniref:hypothetical protein n=1 Tax=Enterococcus sp. TaxID=35783 RepID=UPI002896A02F|nr:hypothetical protein [Enterococcus sp.]